MHFDQIDQDPQYIYEPEQFFENQIMTVREAANFLKCSSKKVYGLVRLRQIPFKKVGREIRFYLPQLKEWMKGD